MAQTYPKRILALKILNEMKRSITRLPGMPVAMIKFLPGTGPNLRLIIAEAVKAYG